jgi:hypothetical protein
MNQFVAGKIKQREHPRASMSAVVAGADETPCNHCCFPLCPATTERAIQNSKITFTKSCLSSSSFYCQEAHISVADSSVNIGLIHRHVALFNILMLLFLSLSLSHTHTQQILGNSNTQQLVLPLGLESTGVACRLTQHNGQGLGCSLIYDIQKVIGASRNLPQI